MSIPGSASPLFFGAGAAEAAAFQIDRSLRFNSADSAYLNRTPSSAGNRRTFTFSCWIKKTADAGSPDDALFTAGTAGATQNRFIIKFSTGNQSLEIGQDVSGSFTLFRKTDQVFRDYSSWGHLVVAFDSTDSTADDRLKIYWNGSQITDFATNNTITQNLDTFVNNTGAHYICDDVGNYHGNLDTYLAEVNFVDGQQLAPTDFGETDDNNVWQPKDTSGLTFGTNGFRLKFDDNSSNSALGNDSSGNDNDFTVNNISAADSDGTIYAEYTGSSNQYLRKSGGGVLPGSNGAFTIECHFYPHSTNVIGLFDGGAGQTSIIRNYGNNTIEKQSGGSVSFAGDYTQNAWNHIAVVYTGSTDTDTFTVYVNGVSSGTSSTLSGFTPGSNFDIGTINAGGDGRFDGFIRNFRVTHSAVYTSAFTAPSHADNLTAITNTKLLVITTPTNGLTTDASVSNYTLTNNGSVSNVTLAAAAQTDSFIDTPTNYTADSGNNGGNYATLNPLHALSTSSSFTNGNLEATVYGSSSRTRQAFSTINPSSGKFYFEVTPTTVNTTMVGLFSPISDSNVGTSRLAIYRSDRYIFKDGSNVGQVASTYAANDVIGVAYDIEGSEVKFYKNGTLDYTISSFTNSLANAIPGFGCDSSTTSNFTTAVVNFGQRPFAYTPPTGYSSLCTTNLPDPTIADGSTAFDAVTYTGNGSSKTISGVGFSPDLIWTKCRNQARSNYLMDLVRGISKYLISEQASQEGTNTTNRILSVTSDGWTLGTNNAFNGNNDTYVAWAWDAGTATASNTDGSITSQVRANQSAGFSIVSYTGNGSANQTVGHGLNTKPSLVIYKDRDAATAWRVIPAFINDGHYLALNNTDAIFTTSGVYFGTNTSSVLGITGSSSGIINASGNDIIALAFSPVEGYSAFGSFTANASTDGPFVYLGFRPALVVCKKTSGTGSWFVLDSARDPINVTTNFLEWNDSDAEASSQDRLDFVSNGFKVRTPSGYTPNETSGDVYLYMAWAEHPFKTARAR